MWSLKYEVINTDSIYTVLSAQYKIVDYLYPVDYYIKKGKVFILGIHLLEGDEQEQKRFIDALKKNRKVKNCEVQKNQIITLIAEEEAFYKQLFAAELYHPSPVIIREGKEIWHVASWNRILLENLLKTLEKEKKTFHNLKFISLQKTDFDEIYFPKVMPQLPIQQKKSFECALQNGYYTYPRKKSLKDLAYKMSVSVSTFQEHLRKAEAKLLPFFARNSTQQ